MRGWFIGPPTTVAQVVVWSSSRVAVFVAFSFAANYWLPYWTVLVLVGASIVFMGWNFATDAPLRGGACQFCDAPEAMLQTRHRPWYRLFGPDRKNARYVCAVCFPILTRLNQKHL